MKFLKRFGMGLLAFVLVAGIVSVLGMSLYDGEYLATVCVLVLGVAVYPSVKTLVEAVWYDMDDYTAYPDEDKNVIKKS